MSAKSVLSVLLMFAGLAVACSQPVSETPKSANQTEAAKPASQSVPAVNPEPANTHSGTVTNDVPPAVKTAFPEAQTINMQHKELTANHVASLEKDYGLKVKPTDFHTYIAYGMSGGKRAQLGAATLVDVAGASAPIQLMVVYDNNIVIKKVSALKGSGDVVAPAFLDQFSGKDHDQTFQLGKDIKYQGSSQADAEAVTKVIKSDILSMQALYGKAHSH